MVPGSGNSLHEPGQAPNNGVSRPPNATTAPPTAQQQQTAHAEQSARHAVQPAGGGMATPAPGPVQQQDCEIKPEQPSSPSQEHPAGSSQPPEQGNAPTSEQQQGTQQHHQQEQQAPVAGEVPVSNLGEVTNEWQLLRMECITENDSRRIIGALDVLLRLSLVAFLILLIYKAISPDAPSNYFCSQTSSIVNAAAGSLCAIAAAVVAAIVGVRLQRSLAVGKKWAPRRQRLLLVHMCQLGAALLGMLCYCASNALVLSPAECSQSAVVNAVLWLSFLRWTSLNCFFLLLTVQAHDTCILQPHAVNAPPLQLLRMSLGLPLVTRHPGQLLPRFQLGDPMTSTGHPGDKTAAGGTTATSGQQQQQGQQGAAAGDAAPAGDIEQGLVAEQCPASTSSSSGAARVRPESAVEQGSHKASSSSINTQPHAKATSGSSSSTENTGNHISSSSAGIAANTGNHISTSGDAANVGTRRTGSRSRPPHKGRPPDAMVLDLPLWYHWPKLLLWLVMEGCLLATVLLTGEHTEGSCTPFLASCELQPCQPLTPIVGLLSGQLAAVLLYYCLWLWLMYRCRSLLRARPWQEYSTANTLFRMQRRLGVWAYSLIVLCLVVFWFIKFGSCSRYSFQYHGTPPVEVMWCAVTVLSVSLMIPYDPKALHPLLISQLQEFAWTEAMLNQRIKERDEATQGATMGQPMFCFETAVKLFYWSCLVYDYEEEAPLYTSPLKEDQLEQLMKAMSLYGLQVHKELYDPVGQVKALFAWSNDVILISFRGSYTRSNWIADAMMWRTRYPVPGPSRRVAGKVHSGFLRCWQKNGMDQQVLSMCKILVEGAFHQDRLKIYLAGHSLGGALATLAAYDLAKTYPQLRPDQISVYTFGAPRAGNHRFAHTYMKTVPDTWHVIHDQDVVPRGGKFLALYKRNGQRVIINRTGDLVVRPGPLEASLLQVPLGSNPLHHLLAGYQASLTAIALAQLDRQKQLPGGTQGLAQLVQDCPLVVEGMYHYGDVRNLVTWLSSRAWYTLRSRAPNLRRVLGAHGAAPRDQQQNGRRARAAEMTAQRKQRQGNRRQRKLGRGRAAAAGAVGLSGEEEESDHPPTDQQQQQQQDQHGAGDPQPAHDHLAFDSGIRTALGDLESGLGHGPSAGAMAAQGQAGAAHSFAAAVQNHHASSSVSGGGGLPGGNLGDAWDRRHGVTGAEQQLQHLAQQRQQDPGVPGSLVRAAAGAAGMLQQLPNQLMGAASSGMHKVLDPWIGHATPAAAAGPEGPADSPPVAPQGDTTTAAAAAVGDGGGWCREAGADVWPSSSSAQAADMLPDRGSNVASSSTAAAARVGPFSAAARPAPTEPAEPTSQAVSTTSSSSVSGTNSYTSPFAALAATAPPTDPFTHPSGTTMYGADRGSAAGTAVPPSNIYSAGVGTIAGPALLAEQRLAQHQTELAAQLDEAATLDLPLDADRAPAGHTLAEAAAEAMRDLPEGVPAPRLTPSLLSDLQILEEVVADQDLDEVRALVLQPAQSAPHALLNPKALESFSKNEQDSGSLAAAAEKLAEGAEKLGESTHKLKHKMKRKARRALQKVGLASIHEGSSEGSEAGAPSSAAAARHPAYTPPGSSTGSVSSYSSAGAASSAASNRTDRSVGSAGGASSSGTTGRRSGTAAGSTTSSRSGSSSRHKPTIDMSALDDRHVVSVNVRRLSLPPPTHVAGSAAVMAPAVHLPLQQEGPSDAE